MRIPVGTLSGGKLSDFGGHKAVRQYRVWVHPRAGGDDSFYSYKTYSGAVASRRRHVKEGRVEATLAVVWDKGAKRYREVVIDTRKDAQ